MARVYEAGVRTIQTSSGTPIADLRTAATTRLRVLEIGFTINAATQTVVGLFRPATAGTVSTSVTPVAIDPADTATSALVGTAWSVLPTISTNVPFRRANLTATIGSGFVWVWSPEDPLVVPISSSLLLWNLAAGSVGDLYIKYQE